MDGGLLEWIQDAVEERWGKPWSWVIYFGLLATLIGVALWLVLHFAGHANP